MILKVTKKECQIILTALFEWAVVESHSLSDESKRFIKIRDKLVNQSVRSKHVKKRPVKRLVNEN